MLELKDVSKRFGATVALDAVTLTLRPHEIHVLLGQNGAGKSTLIRVLAGACQPDSGTMLIGGAPARLASPQHGHRSGIAVIYQEFSLVPSLDIARNIYLGREQEFRRGGLLQLHKMREAARTVLRRLDLDYDPATPVRDLTVAQRQMVEIAKALSRDARILVLDEPTAAVSDREAETLMALIERLREEGRAILYVSHRMNEIIRLGDRVTVLRDGRCVHTDVRGGSTPAALIEKMIGRAPDLLRKREASAGGDVVLETANLTAPGITDASITLRKGEIVGLAGLIGSGRTELLRALYGLVPIRSGEVQLYGKPYRPDASRAVSNALGFIPEDRKGQGLALSLSVGDNLTACSLGTLGPAGIVAPRAARRLADRLISELAIRTASSRTKAAALSGGNQQKIVFAKWLSTRPRLLFLDEPTRGIDVGAKSEIYRLLRELADAGTTVLLVSSDLPELVQLCDRAYVLREGRIAAHIAGSELTEKRILELAVHHDPDNDLR